MAKRLVVIDGADEGQKFPLIEGATLIGNSRKHCDIFLHDLLMSRVQCQVLVDGDRVTVNDLEHSTGTLVNGKKITQQEIHPGDVIRIGNSYLRLQIDDSPEAEHAAAAAANERGKLPHLPFERLEELVDHTLGHYEIESVLGRGHCSVVFRAHDTKDDRTVALRVLSADFPGSETEMQRFVKVLKVLLPLHHPHLVALHGAGKAGPYCWIAMEYVDGESVAQILVRTNADRKIDWQRGWRVALHAARALDYIHRRRQLHSNITPKNLLVQAGDRVTKLNDFLIGKALEGSKLLNEALEPKLLAELPYLAPEQTQTGAFVDQLSDIYSLGTVIYHLLTGQPPFQGQSVEETIALIQDPGPPTKPRKLQKGIPEALERVVLHMLIKHQEDRFQTAAELVAALEQVGSQHGVEA